MILGLINAHAGLVLVRIGEPLPSGLSLKAPCAARSGLTMNPNDVFGPQVEWQFSPCWSNGSRRQRIATTRRVVEGQWSEACHRYG